VFLNCSTHFDRHTAHHQELKNCNCSLWFYMRLWLPAAVMSEWALSAHSAITADARIHEHKIYQSARRNKQEGLIFNPHNRTSHKNLNKYQFNYVHNFTNYFPQLVIFHIELPNMALLEL